MEPAGQSAATQTDAPQFDIHHISERNAPVAEQRSNCTVNRTDRNYWREEHTPAQPHTPTHPHASIDSCICRASALICMTRGYAQTAAVCRRAKRPRVRACDPHHRLSSSFGCANIYSNPRANTRTHTHRLGDKTATVFFCSLSFVCWCVQGCAHKTYANANASGDCNRTGPTHSLIHPPQQRNVRQWAEIYTRLAQTNALAHSAYGLRASARARGGKQIIAVIFY